MQARGVALVTRLVRDGATSPLYRGPPSAPRGARPHPARAHPVLTSSSPPGRRPARGLDWLDARDALDPCLLARARARARRRARAPARHGRGAACGAGWPMRARARAFLESDGPLHDPFALGRHGGGLLADRGRDRGRAHGSSCTATTTSTACARPRSRSRCCGCSAPRSSRSCRAASSTATAWPIASVEQLAAAGAGLLLTVDCGIAAPEAVARARELGLDVVVTDHHRPGERAARRADRRLARARSGAAYPFADLCGTGVVLKLAQALWARRHGGDPAALPPALDQLSDLVALATVADVVPLRDENRALVRRGLRRLAEAERPGLRALMSSAGVDPARLRTSDLSFRLAPRINAAGRLGDPGARARPAARALARRRPAAGRAARGAQPRAPAVEDTILRAAAAEIERSGAIGRGDRVLVAAGEGWHEGVIGIVASRLVDRHARPVVLIALDGERGKGSGRSVSAYDLHAGLAACSEHLERFGGHRAAAGLSISAASVEAFAAATARACRACTCPRTAASAARSWTPSSPSARSRSTWPASSPASSRAATAIPASTCSSPARS